MASLESQLALCTCGLRERGALPKGFSGAGNSFLLLPPHSLRFLPSLACLADILQDALGWYDAHEASALAAEGACAPPPPPLPLRRDVVQVQERLHSVFSCMRLMLTTKAEELQLLPGADAQLQHHFQLQPLVRALELYAVMEALALAADDGWQQEAMANRVANRLLPALDLANLLRQALDPPAATGMLSELLQSVELIARGHCSGTQVRDGRGAEGGTGNTSADNGWPGKVGWPWSAALCGSSCWALCGGRQARA